MCVFPGDKFSDRGLRSSRFDAAEVTALTPHLRLRAASPSIVSGFAVPSWQPRRAIRSSSRSTAAACSLPESGAVTVTRWDYMMVAQRQHPCTWRVPFGHHAHTHTGPSLKHRATTAAHFQRIAIAFTWPRCEGAVSVLRQQESICLCRTPSGDKYFPRCCHIYNITGHFYNPRR